MATNPKVKIDVYHSGQLIASDIECVYAKVENIAGLNADWFTTIIGPRGMDRLISFDSKSMKFSDYIVSENKNARLLISMGYNNDLVPRIYGFVHDVSYTAGSVGKLIKITGGDLSYYLNTIYTGDYMLQEGADKYKGTAAYPIGKTPVNTIEPTNRSKPYLNDNSGISIIKQMFKLEGPKAVGSLYEYKRSEFSIYATASVAADTNPIFGDTKAKRYELQGDLPNKYYQSNNRTLLEVLDDVCFKCGWDANPLPGSSIIVINGDVKKTAPVKAKDTIKPKFDEDAGSIEDNWIKFNKNSYFDAGLKIGINYWDWMSSVKNEKTISQCGPDICITGKAQWAGNNTKDIAAQVYLDYEKVNQQAADRRAYIAINRLITQRVTVQGAFPGRPDLFPGDEIILEDCGPLSGQYYLTSISCAIGAKGFSMQFAARLPDLIYADKLYDLDDKNGNPIIENRFNKVLIGQYFK